MTHFVSKAAKVLVISAAATMLLAGFAMAAEEDMAVAVGATTGSSLRMRAEASTSASIVTTLDKGVAVAVLDDTLDGWYKVAFNDSTGFVSADYMVIDQDNVFESYGRVNADGVNVRSDASTDSEVLASVEGKVELITDVDTAAFQEACQSIYENLKTSDPEVYSVVEQIQNAG